MSEEETNHQEEESKERSYTQADLDRVVKNRLKTLKSELEARPTSDQLDELQAKIDELMTEKDLHGKSEMERIEHQHTREFEKLTNQYTQLEAQLKERDTLVADAQQRLRSYQLESAFSAALGKAGVYAKGAPDALKVLMSEIQEPEISDSGVRATYGDEFNEPPEVIAKKFLEDRPHFATATVGGAGTTAPNGMPRHKNLDDMSVDELWAAAGPDPSTADH